MAEVGLLSHDRTLIDSKRSGVWYRNADKIQLMAGKYGLYVELVSGKTLKANDALFRFKGSVLRVLMEKKRKHWP